MVRLFVIICYKGEISLPKKKGK